MAIVYALTCAVLYGVADYSGGRASRSASSVYIALIGQACSLVLLGLAIAVMGTAFPDSADLAWGAFSGVSGVVALVAFYHALSHGSMTVVAPITAVVGAVIPVAVGLARGERPGGLAYVGIACALVGIALVSGVLGARHQPIRPATVAAAVVAGIGFAGVYIALAEVSAESEMWPLAAARVVSVSLLVLVAVTVTSRRGPGIGQVRGEALPLAVLGGLLDVAANYAYLLAIRTGLLSVVAVVASLYPVPTVALALGLDRERMTRSQWAGTGFAVAALVMVSAG